LIKFQRDASSPEGTPAGIWALAKTGTIDFTGCNFGFSFLNLRTISHEAMTKLSSTVISRTILMDISSNSVLSESEL
jgi:hypothetical protein